MVAPQLKNDSCVQTTTTEIFEAKVISTKCESVKEGDNTEVQPKSHGMNFWVASFFLLAQMAGAGFLALPKSLSDCGWTGVVFLVLFCVLVGFSGTRLGHCWVILEERWPEYRLPARQPYIDISYRAYGRAGRIISLTAILITCLGSCVVYIILMAQFLSSLIHDVSFCVMTIIVGAVLIIPSWAGTPNDFWQAAVLSVVAAVISFIVVLVQLLVDKDTFPEPRYDNPSFVSFSLGFGTILFAYGGASVFPNVQNDMTHPSHFWKSVLVSFAVLVIMYIPVAVTGYVLLGSAVPSNILLYAGENLSIPLKVAVILEAVHLVVTWVISNNSAVLIFEEFLDMPRHFGWRRCVFRTSVAVLEILVCLIFPDFGLILNLVGGSTITMCSFLFPPIFYMKLVKDSSLNKNWRQRTIPMWEKIALYIIILVGIVGGISATGSAVLEIIKTPFSSTCFSQFING